MKLQLVTRGAIIFTGSSGSGKTRFMEMNPHIPLFDLDSYGARKEGKWVTDVRLLPSEGIPCGTSSNMDEVAAHYRKLHPGGLTLYYLMPDPRAWKAANALKAEEKPDLPFAPDWRRRGAMTNSEAEIELRADLHRHVKRVKPDDVIIVKLPYLGEPTVGWHQTPKVKK